MSMNARTEPRTTLHYCRDGVHVRSVAYAPLEAHARHCHESASITLIYSGAIEEATRSGTRRSGVCSLVVKPADVYHENVYGPRGARTLQLAIEPALVPELDAVTTYRWHDGGPAARLMVSMLRCVRGNGSHVDDVHTCIIDLLALLGDRTPDSAERCRPTWLDDLREHLDAYSAEPISIRTLAESRGLHPVSLARTFRRHYGCSISEYVRRRRILNACALIDAEEEALASVAVAAGFADQSHLTRAFKAEVGLPPGRFRGLIH